MNLNIPRQILVIYFMAISILIAIAVVSVEFHIKIPTFTRDVTAIANIALYSGFLSNLGIYLWCVSASASFFAAMVLRDINQTKNFSFLFSSALLSTYLMFDDAFQFHETLADKLFGISNDKVVTAILGIAVFVYLKSFINVILKTKYISLLLAFAFLSLSVVSDTILEPWSQLGQWEYFIEDGAKWIGIVSWCIYHVRTAFLFVVHAYELPNKAN